MTPDPAQADTLGRIVAWAAFWGALSPEQTRACARHPWTALPLLTAAPVSPTPAARARLDALMGRLESSPDDPPPAPCELSPFDPDLFGPSPHAQIYARAFDAQWAAETETLQGEGLSAAQWAAQCGKSPRQARRLLRERRVPGAHRLGPAWAVPPATAWPLTPTENDVCLSPPSTPTNTRRSP